MSRIKGRPLVLALLALVCAAAVGCRSPGWSVEMSDDGENWASSLIAESKPVGAENELSLYIRARRTGAWWPFLTWVKLETQNMDYEWQPEYYYLRRIGGHMYRYPIEEGQVIPWPFLPFETAYLEVRLKEPEVPSSHLFAAFTLYGRGFLWGWRELGTVSAAVLVPGNLMFTQGEPDLFAEWIDGDVVVKTTDVDEAASADSHNYTLKTRTETFTIRILNLDNATATCVFEEARNDFTGIVRYYTDGQEITQDAKADGYQIPQLQPGEDFLIRMVVLPVGKTADYEGVTVLASLTEVVSPVEYTGPFQRFDAANLGFIVTPDKTGISGWREKH